MTDLLDEYNRKRNFEKTPEPESGAAEQGDFLHFVVQHHLARKDHFDFRLEWAGALLSWAVPKGPSYSTRDRRLAVRVEDHPLEYRNFEGIIPEGEYGGGTVMLWDEGSWEPLFNVDEGLDTGSLKFILNGKRLKGKWALVRMKTSGDAKENWLLLKEKDSFVKDNDGISEFDTSIRTGRTMAEIEKGEDEKIVRNPFDSAGAQLAKLETKIPSDGDWLYELKYDGYRILAFVENNSVRLLTRNQNDFTKHYVAVASSILGWAAGRAMVLDGEMAVTDESGKTDFGALQNYMKNPDKQNLTYIIFDLLALDGIDLRDQPLIKRKEKLEVLMKDAPSNLHFSRHVMGEGERSYKTACELGMEGIVGKKASSPYSGTRNGDWIKLKCGKRQEFVIGGFTRTDKKTSGVSSLLLGVYDGDRLIYSGRAGTGFGMSEAKELIKKFEPLIKSDTPFAAAPKPRAGEKITWLEPNLTAEIRFAEWTSENLLRQASFKGLRFDKDPREIRREKADDRAFADTPAEEPEEPMGNDDGSIIIKGIKITSPDKVMYDNPRVTKADVVNYYAGVSERMLPYLSRRILSIVRCPKGINESCFYKKHPGPGSRGVVTVPVKNSDGETEEYFYIEDEAGLISEAQMGTLEFHVWGSRAGEPEKPDVMVFDLDPDVGMNLDRVRQGVRDLKSILTELSLTSFLKTSGGKGYHVVVPLKPSVSWDTFHDFARRVAEVMEGKWPDRYTSNVRKSKREDKIFIDWMRNGRGATSVAPYSLRARKGAKVSIPISWDELDTVPPDGIAMKAALSRIAAPDPWVDFFKCDQMLK